jgi:hypothetical protein
VSLSVTATAADGVYLISDEQTVIATVHRGGRELAQKMAAAPELLEALEALRLQALQSELNSPANEWGWEALQLANAAIAKATGGADPVERCHCGAEATTTYDGDRYCQPCAAYSARRDFEEDDMPGGFA